MAYCAPAEVREAGTQITANAPVAATDAYLTKLIERASRFFDSVVGVSPQFFEAAGDTATGRTFYGDGTNFLRLDAYVAGSLVAAIIVPADYEVPTFIQKDGFLVLTTTEGNLAHALTPFPAWYRSGSGWWAGQPITVTARWGYVDTPPDVKMAIIQTVITWLRTIDPAAAKVLDIAPESVPPLFEEIAAIYRRKVSVLV